MEITSRNTNTLAQELYPWLAENGQPVKTRNGDALRAPGVTTMVLTHPNERVNFSHVRDANPFFHLIEALAMLANVNDVALMSYYAKNMLLYTDDGQTYNAFYGTRARNFKGVDQLKRVISILRQDPESRQALIQLWDVHKDLGTDTKDKACNLCLLMEVDQDTGAVNMTTFNRSNDAVWGGVTGANVVHLSMFQEYVAQALEREIGEWRHVSANLHVYVENPKWPGLLEEAKAGTGLGVTLYPNTYRLFWGDPVKFDEVIQTYLRQITLSIATASLPQFQPSGCSLLDEVAKPMAIAYFQQRNGHKEEAYASLDNCPDTDWIIAARNWLARRHAGKV